MESIFRKIDSGMPEPRAPPAATRHRRASIHATVKSRRVVRCSRASTSGNRAADALRRFSSPVPRTMTYSLATSYTRELEIRKSRFIAYALPVADRDAAMAELQRLRAEHPTATHVCWALLAGGQSGMSDDGEPSGTAGRPILEVLRHHDLDGVLAAVVRYYGGVKLGAGGLVRAYTDAIAAALLNAERIERITLARLAIELGYPDEARIRRWIEQEGYTLVDSAYTMTVRLVITLPATAQDAARAALLDLTQGRAGFPAFE